MVPSIILYFYFSRQIDQPSLPISREVLIKGFEDKIVQAYYKYQNELAVLLGADKKRAEKEMKDVVNFEIALAKVGFVHGFVNKVSL